MNICVVVVIKKPRKEQSGRLLSKLERGVSGGVWFWRIAVLGGAFLESGSVLDFLHVSWGVEFCKAF